MLKISRFTHLHTNKPQRCFIILAWERIVMQASFPIWIMHGSSQEGRSLSATLSEANEKDRRMSGRECINFKQVLWRAETTGCCHVLTAFPDRAGEMANISSVLFHTYGDNNKGKGVSRLLAIWWRKWMNKKRMCKTTTFDQYRWTDPIRFVSSDVLQLMHASKRTVCKAKVAFTLLV